MKKIKVNSAIAWGWGSSQIISFEEMHWKKLVVYNPPIEETIIIKKLAILTVPEYWFYGLIILGFREISLQNQVGRSKFKLARKLGGTLP